jgi:hypothetical protein
MKYSHYIIKRLLILVPVIIGMTLIGFILDFGTSDIKYEANLCHISCRGGYSIPEKPPLNFDLTSISDVSFLLFFTLILIIGLTSFIVLGAEERRHN